MFVGENNEGEREVESSRGSNAKCVFQRLSTRCTLVIELMSEWMTQKKPTGVLELLLALLDYCYAVGKTRLYKTNRPTLGVNLEDRVQ